eukprot:CAMPEP_0183785120 /NCGR_PEP_ID=MMETSP0739-20130205/66337_1 /TAXON_ID=385413 /ORGANISM="Thalassiosira miniscula, Strain CCMP1093" /LENGTH=323 /DNA_ID=CAMNT_0026029115 /DNA_START=86 /DNA_END=1057 /DNA_ORIENTATION=+
MASPLAIKLETHNERDSGQEMDEQCVICCISAMLRQEEQYLCHDYLGIQSAESQHLSTTHVIDETCRSKMCEWIYHVIDSTRLQRETASVAMGFLDRYLSSSSERAEGAKLDRKEYQLAAMTCLYIAVKIREPFEMDAGLMSRLSRGMHSAEEITTLEYDILIALQWKVNGPTPIQFINHIMELLPDSAKSAAPTLYEHSHFQAELAVGDYAFVPYLRQSTIAVASILNSLSSIERGSHHFNECVEFIQDLSSAFDLDIDSPVVNAVRARLLHSFAKSSGYDLTEGVVPIVPTQQIPLKSGAFQLEDSPHCVSKPLALEDFMS